MRVGQLDSKKLVFLVLFFVLSLASMRLNFIPVYGAPGQYLSFFQFFAPIAGGFLGGIPAIITVFAAEVADLFLQSKALTPVTIMRLFPVLLGVWFFSRHKPSSGIAVSAIGIAAWLLHPVGREAWFYSLLFLVPLAGGFLLNLAGRSFGAAYSSFVAGQVLWLYLFPTTAADWASWIPVVILERTSFAIGIALSYVAFNTLLSRLQLPQGVWVEARYDLVKIVEELPLHFSAGKR